MASPTVFRHEAMATWFELRTYEPDTEYARQAAGEAFRLLDRLEGLLSRFRESSEVAAIARLEPGESIKIHSDVVDCLAVAIEMEELTRGAFNPALGAREAETVPGILHLDAEKLTVQVTEGRVSLDLGAIGKGWALDQMATLLTEWGIGPSLLVGGGSSILAVGAPEEPWKVALSRDCHIQLHSGSVGCSGLTVKGRHILDPRTGQPAAGATRAWALSARAAVSDALSTAFMILTPEEIQAVLADRPEAAGILQMTEASEERLHFGRALGVHHAIVRT